MFSTLMLLGQNNSGHYQAGRVVGMVIGAAILLIIVVAIVKKIRGK